MTRKDRPDQAEGWRQNACRPPGSGSSSRQPARDEVARGLGDLVLERGQAMVAALEQAQLNVGVNGPLDEGDAVGVGHDLVEPPWPRKSNEANVQPRRAHAASSAAGFSPPRVEPKPWT